MSFDINSISTEKRTLPPRMVLLGTPKVGKTTFASKAPNVIMLPVKGEEGADDMECAKFPTAESFNDVLTAMQTLAEQEHGFQFVCIDSISALERIVFEHVCEKEKASSIEKVGNGYGKGYIEAMTYWSRLLACIDYLRTERGMGCILIGHTKIRTVNDPLATPYDAYIWDVNDRLAGMLDKWADCTLFANMKIVTNVIEESTSKKTKDKDDRRTANVDMRVLLTQRRPSHPGGGRGVYGRIPYELPLDWDKFIEAVTAASN